MAGTAVPQQDRLQVQVHYGLTSAEFTVHSQKLLRAADSQDDSATVEDVRAAVRQALEAPVDFPPLYRALTPDDRLAIVVNEYFRRLPDLLIPLLEHVQQAGVSLERITLLCPPRIPGVAPPPWREELPPAFAQVRVEEHDPGDRARLAYLAGTQGGRRLYLNRTLVEADQIIVAGPAEYDPVLGYGGGLGDLFPNLADAPTRQEFLRRTVEDPPAQTANPALREAEEVGWLIGVPFWLAAVPGPGDTVRAIFAGPAATIAPLVRRALDAQSCYRFPWRAEVVVTAVSGDPRWHRFHDLTRALAAASRLVQQGGKIIALSQLSAETLGPAARQLGQFESPVAALTRARRQQLADMQTVWHLAVAARRAHLYLYGNLPHELVENMFATALTSLQEVQRLLDHAESCIFLPDGHRANALVLGTMPATA